MSIVDLLALLGYLLGASFCMQSCEIGHTRVALFFAVLLVTTFALFLAAKDARAEDFPDQNYLANAHQNAIDFLVAKGCKKTKIFVLSKYASQETPDGIKITGPDYRVRCIETGKKVSLMWSKPTQREDGSAVVVRHYLLTHNGVTGKLGAATSITIPDLDEGLHSFAVRAVDHAGIASKPSNEVVF